MPRALRVPHPGLDSGVVQLSEAERHYVCRVHRLGVGDDLVLFDPEAGTEADARLLESKRGDCQVGPLRPGARLGFPGLSVFLARPKSAALERVVRDAVAFSVGRLVLIDSEYAVAKVEGNPRRLRDIALDEARQCERGDLPLLLGPTPFQGAVAEAFAATPATGRHLLLDPREAELALLDALSPAPALANPGALSLWVGPEGGFSDAERKVLLGKAIAVHLGPLVLRVAGAVAAALATVTAVAHSQRTCSNWAERVGAS